MNMKPGAIRQYLIFILFVIPLLIAIPHLSVNAQESLGPENSRLTDKSYVQLSETETPTEPLSPTPTSTAPSSAGGRPLVIVDSFSTGSYAPTPGQEFDLVLRLRNAGQAKARNVVVSFTPGDFVPRGNGGVIAAGTIATDASTPFTQRLMASPGLMEQSVGLLALEISYEDEGGNSYSGQFSLGVPIGTKPQPTSAPSSGSRAAPTPTATPLPRPQILIENYEVDVSTLHPGIQFNLTLHMNNVGGLPANRITMILGGGVSEADPGNDPNGDKNGGGVSGAGGDFTNFAPLGSSNVKFLGSIEAGDTLSTSLELIVNSGTKPGAYPVKFSFVYNDGRGGQFTDDQVITLIVESSPILDISFYRTADPLFAGQPASLPIQIINFDRSSVILNQMRVTAAGATLENNVILVGYLDAGGFFTFDPMIIADLPGPITIQIAVDYVDDFNRKQTIVQEMTLEVGDAPVFEPGPIEDPGAEGPVGEPAPESPKEKLVRLLKGLLGLDSGRINSVGDGETIGPGPIIEGHALPPQ